MNKKPEDKSTSEKLMEILKELKNCDGEVLFGYSGYYNCQAEKLQQAHDQIIELWKECLPKEEWCECIGNCQHEDDTRGFNRAITEAEKNMEGAR